MNFSMSVFNLVASVRNEFSIPRGQRCCKCDPLNFLFRGEGEQHTLKHPRLVEQRCAPNVRFPLESSYIDTVCYLEFQMAKLRNHTIKQKVLGTSGSGCGVTCFLMKVERKTQNEFVPDGHSIGLLWLL